MYVGWDNGAVEICKETRQKGLEVMFWGMRMFVKDHLWRKEIVV